jgi:uncharacterized SAM-binding protein YcdF (DUF218 family)
MNNDQKSEKRKKVSVKSFFKGISKGIQKGKDKIDFEKVFRLIRNTGTVFFILGMILFPFTQTTKHIAIFVAGLGGASALYGIFSLNLISEKYGKLFKIGQIVIGTMIQFVLISFIVVTAITVDFSKSDEFPILEYCIVPGAQVVGTEPGEILMTRIVDTADYLREFTQAKAILCGGLTGGAAISEAECMYNELVALGIDSSRLIKEDKSFDTEQNFRNAKVLLDALEGEQRHKVVIISSEYHLFRCRNIAKKVGLQGFAFHVNTPTDAFIIQDSYVREYFSNVLFAAELIYRR